MTGTDIQWRTISASLIDPEQFGRDHWSTFAYVETRAVDHRGTIAHDHMRTHARRHPILMSAKKTVFGPSADGSAYPTILAGDILLDDHDDHDCLDDLVAAGLLEVHMPDRMTFGGTEAFADAYGRPALDLAGDVIRADEVTGYVELWLCAYATFSLTERGFEVASRLRQHRAGGGSFGTFRMR